MVLHASLTSFRKLSIPRDSYAAIPDCGEQKINASLACNTQQPQRQPRLDDQDRRELPRDRHQPHRHRRLRRVRRLHQHPRRGHDRRAEQQQEEGRGRLRRRRRRQEAGRRVDQAAARRASPRGRQGARLRPDPAQHLRPLRGRPRPGRPPAGGPERDQGPPDQHHPLPYNFIKGPWIGWNAPKAFISDMGGFTLPQLAISAILGGSGETNVLGGRPAPTRHRPGRKPADPQGDCERGGQEADRRRPAARAACSPG